jgi:membrane-bound ClpP family serine protease
MSVLSLLGVAFVVLKLIGVISWSWWLVLLPFYGVLVLMAGIYLGAYGLVGLITLLEKIVKVFRRKPKKPTMQFRGSNHG